jgi:hypothetical protein
MKLNPTLLEIILAFLISLSVYLWLKYRKHIVHWDRRCTPVFGDRTD